MIPFTVFVCVLSQWETEVFKLCNSSQSQCQGSGRLKFSNCVGWESSKQQLLKAVLHVLAMFMLMLVLILVTSDCSGSAFVEDVKDGSAGFVGWILVWICNE